VASNVEPNAASLRQSMDRRRFFALSALALGAVPLGCGANETLPDAQKALDPERLIARPQQNTTPFAPGRQALGLGDERDGFLYIPAGYQHGQPTPLLTLFHGATQRAELFAGTTQLADRHNVILLVPDARSVTWDRIRGGFGRDVEFTNTALERIFQHCSVDPRRIGLGGFSDGATYALSLGLTNGDLVTHIVAFSPGFVAAGKRRGRPRIYVTHGERDQILPIDRTSRQLVPVLKNEGYHVVYKEFDGRHEVPERLRNDAFEWFKRG
jgi:phospholipase/carboxylesterase